MSLVATAGITLRLSFEVTLPKAEILHLFKKISNKFSSGVFPFYQEGHLHIEVDEPVEHVGQTVANILMDMGYRYNGNIWEKRDDL